MILGVRAHDYGKIKTRKPYINVILEGASPETAVESGEFLKTLYEKV